MVVAVMVVVVASLPAERSRLPQRRRGLRVATKTSGPNAGLTVASALLVDYILTVAVSTSAASANIASAIPWFGEHLVALTAGLIVIITLLNLRGSAGSGRCSPFRRTPSSSGSSP